MTASLTITLRIPAGTPWPVEGRDPTTGHVRLQAGFLDAVARASDLAPDALTEDMVADLLTRWYVERVRAGYPRDPIMDALAREELGAALEIPPDAPPDKAL